MAKKSNSRTNSLTHLSGVQPQLIEPLRHFLLKPPRLKLFRVLEADELEAMIGFSPDLPPQFFPFLRRETGDSIGLYVLPALEEPTTSAFASSGVIAVEADGLLRPLDGDIKRFLANPDKYSIDNKINDGEWPKPRGKKKWKPLLFDFQSATPELELLKPLVLNSSSYQEIDQPHVQKLIERFGSSDGVAAIIREHLHEPEDVFDRTCWLKLADDLIKQQHYIQALRALDNCRLTFYIYPQHGYSSRLPRWLTRERDALALLEKTFVHAKVYGTSLESFNILRLIEWKKGHVQLARLHNT